MLRLPAIWWLGLKLGAKHTASKLSDSFGKSSQWRTLLLGNPGGSLLRTLDPYLVKEILFCMRLRYARAILRTFCDCSGVQWRSSVLSGSTASLAHKSIKASVRAPYVTMPIDTGSREIE